jgi:hypothetical protein
VLQELLSERDVAHWSQGPAPAYNPRKPFKEVIPVLKGRYAAAERKGFQRCVIAMMNEISPKWRDDGDTDGILPIRIRPDFYLREGDTLTAIEVVNRKPVSCAKADYYWGLADDLLGQEITLRLAILDKYGNTWWEGLATEPFYAQPHDSDLDEDIMKYLVGAAT